MNHRVARDVCEHHNGCFICWFKFIKIKLGGYVTTTDAEKTKNLCKR